MVESIGDILRRAREQRGLSEQQVHDATKIMVQSIIDLENNRFDRFANKVYARAFLRDYANYLNLDSAELLQAYEAEWSGAASEQVPAAKKNSLAWRAVGYAFLILVMCVGVVSGGYFAWKARSQPQRIIRVTPHPTVVKDPTVATMPKAQPVTPPKPEPVTVKPAEPKPEPVVVPDKVVVEVLALRPVWIGVKVDGKTVTQQILDQDKSLKFEGDKSVTVRAGMAGAVQIKVNGETQPPLGSLKTPGEKTFTRPEQTASPQVPAKPQPESN